MPRLFRIVRWSSLEGDPFISNLAACRLPRGPEVADPLIWAGLSVLDTHAAAETFARRYHGKLGGFIAVLAVPEDDRRAVVRSTLGPGHYTLLVCPALCQRWVQSVIPMPGLTSSVE